MSPIKVELHHNHKGFQLHWDQSNLHLILSTTETLYRVCIRCILSYIFSDFTWNEVIMLLVVHERCPFIRLLMTPTTLETFLYWNNSNRVWPSCLLCAKGILFTYLASINQTPTTRETLLKRYSHTLSWSNSDPVWPWCWLCARGILFTCLASTNLYNLHYSRDILAVQSK